MFQFEYAYEKEIQNEDEKRMAADRVCFYEFPDFLQ
jgi:hypothetical protein